MRMQLANRDRFGMTVAMLGVRSRNVAVVVSIMEEIEQTEVFSTVCAISFSFNNKFLLELKAPVCMCISRKSCLCQTTTPFEEYLMS